MSKNLARKIVFVCVGSLGGGGGGGGGGGLGVRVRNSPENFADYFGRRNVCTVESNFLFQYQSGALNNTDNHSFICLLII